MDDNATTPGERKETQRVGRAPCVGRGSLPCRDLELGTESVKENDQDKLSGSAACKVKCFGVLGERGSRHGVAEGVVRLVKVPGTGLL